MTTFPDPTTTYDIRGSKQTHSNIKWYLTPKEAVLFNEVTNQVIGVYNPLSPIPKVLDPEHTFVTDHFKQRAKERFNITSPTEWFATFQDKLTLSHVSGDVHFYTYKNIRLVVTFTLDAAIVKTVYPVKQDHTHEIETVYEKELSTLKRKYQFSTAQALLRATLTDIDIFVDQSKNLKTLPKLDLLDDLIVSLERIMR